MPDKRTAVKLAVLYRAVATASFLVGAIIGLVGLWLGLADAVGAFFENLLEGGAVSQAMAEANLLVMFVFMTVGVLVWQVGKAAALHWTLATAVEAGANGARPAPSRSSTGPTTAPRSSDRPTDDDAGGSPGTAPSAGTPAGGSQSGDASGTDGSGADGDGGAS